MADRIKFLSQITPSSNAMGAGDTFVVVRGSTDLLFTPAQVTAIVGGGGGGGTPGGAVNSVQFNNAGAFGGYTNVQLTSLIQPFSSTLSGAVPLSGGGTTNFLRADGTWTAPAGGGGTSQGGNVALFSTLGAVQAATILDTTTFVSVTGFKLPDDGGAGTYQRVGTLPSVYTGDGFTNLPVLPPSFTSGHYPVNVFSTTFVPHSLAQNVSSIPITAGCLTLIMVWDGTVAPPSTATDSAGNTYLLACHGDNAGTHPVALYYCANPVFAPVGTTFSLSSGVASLDVYCVQGFTGAILDQTVVQNTSTGVATGMTISTGVLTTSPELVIGAAHTGMSPTITGPTPGLAYSLSAGWTDLSPPKYQRNPLGCIVAASTSPVTFAPTWSPNLPTYSALIATFKTFPKPALDPGFWSLLPTFPLHTAQYAIDPATPDNFLPFQQFGRYLASIAPASGETDGRAGTGAEPITISIANPAVITLVLGRGQHVLSSGQRVSFTTTGALPAPLVVGQMYYIQNGTVTPAGFSITSTNILDGSGATVAKGTTISTLGGTQSGTHNLVTYGESCTDFVLDPGVYYSSQNSAIGIGLGLKLTRLLGNGARIATNTSFYCVAWNDVNSNTSGSGLGYSAPFQTTTAASVFPSQVTLVTPALATNFNVNGWVILMAIEMLHRTDANWDPAIFEFAKIKSVNASTGVITFWDTLQYNYRSTYPSFPAPVGSVRGVPIGPATMVQLSEVFDQHIEVHGLNINAPTQQSMGGVLSVRFVDCDVWGWGYKCGPSPTFAKTIKFEECRFHESIQEVDKSIDLLIYEDCEFDNQSGLLFQSAGINKCVINRCRIPNDAVAFGIEGTPNDLTIRDSYIGRISVGPAIGATQRMTWINSHISTVESILAQGDVATFADMTFSNGTLKTAAGHINISTFTPWAGPSDSVCPANWAAPGNKIAICTDPAVTSTGGRLRPTMCTGMMTCFTVLDVYTDGSNNFCIDTDLPALQNMTITVTGTVSNGSGASGNILNITAISPVGAAPLAGMDISGGGLPNGIISTTSLLTGGSGYVNATYTSVPVTGGTGSGAVWSSITVAGGTVTAATLGTGGTNYKLSDIISASTASLGGTGSGFTAQVDRKTGTTIQNDLGIPNATNNLGNYTLSNSALIASTTFTVTTNLYFLPHDCPRFTVINCTGGRTVADMAGAPPNIPMYSYFRRAFAGFILNSPQLEATVRLAGNLMYWDIDVQKPYTGLDATYTCTIYMFGYAVSAGITYPTYITQVINLKTAGKRTVSALTTAGGVTGDALVTVPIWLTGGHNVLIGPPTGLINGSDTLSTQPRIVMTAQTDQGIDFSSEFVYPSNANTRGYDSLADQTTQALLF
jgi:hypothetical protein